MKKKSDLKLEVKVTTGFHNFNTLLSVGFRISLSPNFSYSYNKSSQSPPIRINMKSMKKKQNDPESSTL